MKTITSHILSISIVVTFVAVTLFAICQTAFAFDWDGLGTDANVELQGWAWSSNIGWISVNCETGGLTANDICSSSNYEVEIDKTNGELDGYAWNSNIGWIKFGGLSGCPGGNCDARIVENATVLELQGWARAESYGGGWDGWISLSCENMSECSTSNYQPTFGSGIIGGTTYAWGSFIVGWIDLSGIVFTPPCGSETSTCNGDDLETIDAWCRLVDTVTCPGGCSAGACVVSNPSSNNFTPNSTVVRADDTVEVTVDVSNVLTSCVVLTIEGTSNDGDADDVALLPDGSSNVNGVWTSPKLTGATIFRLECDGVPVGDEFTVQVIPISTEI